MSERLSKFEEVIGDVEAFRLMLDGAFKEWKGTYDVLLSDTGEYLFHPKEEQYFRPFCRKLRSNPGGEKWCWECDRDAAREAAQKGHPVVYLCHAGLIDAAVPILIDGELVATIFCGQGRPEDEALDREGLEKAHQLERALGFDAGELMRLWEQTPPISEGEINSTKDRVWKLVNYISWLGHERLELRQAHKRDQQRLEESKALEEVAKGLSRLVGKWDEFWNRINQVLEQMIAVIGASCAMVLIPESSADPSGKLVVKAVAQLPTVFLGRSYSLYDQAFRKVVEEGEITPVPFGKYRDPNTICGSIRQLAPSLAAGLDEVVLARIGLGDEQAGMLLFFLNKEQDVSGSLSIQEEKGALVHLASLIGAAYHNCSLYQARQQDVILRRSWLRQVTHQLLSPLHGLQGYAEDAKGRLQRWQRVASQDSVDWTGEKVAQWKDELKRWERSFESIRWSSHYAARLASNLAWVVFTDGQRKEKPVFELVEDVGGLLIRCARDFQGIARERGLRKVEVNTQEGSTHSVACLNGQICVNEDLFRQAVGNLLDNAVKYSDRGTDILIEGGYEGERAEIRVINTGIRLYPEEVEEIFRENYRTREARSRHPTGTGIGLTVAREIIELHGGTLRAQPSEWTSHGWQTICVISLSMHSEECR
jgi:signal transduction histidine kinase/ligand-binding sensor protein